MTIRVLSDNISQKVHNLEELVNETTAAANRTKELLQIVEEQVDRVHTDAAKALSDVEGFNASRIEINFSKDNITEIQKGLEEEKKRIDGVINERNEIKRKVDQVILEAKKLIDSLQKNEEVCVYVHINDSLNYLITEEE